MSDLVLYNTFSHTKEKFVPICPPEVNLYVCGMTVYDYCHLGHARLYASIDVMVRYLRYLGYQVKYVRNITDIDDKIIIRAKEEGIAWDQLTHKFIHAMDEDFSALGILKPDLEPKATEHINAIIALIQTLLNNETAYIASNGDIYYDVTKFKDYGKLAQKDLSGQDAGHRIEVASVKKNAGDFILWKLAKPGEPFWSSPWGEGRPGWHIECSAMSMAHLGQHFDIHGGGFDLQFPHHENEIAQSEAASGGKFVNYWIHIGFLQINREKMSKSLGNFFTIREVLSKFHPELVRYFLIASHYRTQLNFSFEHLQHAKGSLDRLYHAIDQLHLPASYPSQTPYEASFNKAMNDDFNTPEALAVLFELSHDIQRLRLTDAIKASSLGALLKHLTGLLGLLQYSPESYFQHGLEDMVHEINLAIHERNEARKTKNWALADDIRNRLLSQGIELEDNIQGTTWRKK